MHLKILVPLATLVRRISPLFAHGSNDVSAFTGNYSIVATQKLRNLGDRLLLNCPDLSVDLTSDGVLTIENDALNNSRKSIVINKHDVTRKIWYSSPYGPPRYFSGHTPLDVPSAPANALQSESDFQWSDDCGAYLDTVALADARELLS